MLRYMIRVSVVASLLAATSFTAGAADSAPPRSHLHSHSHAHPRRAGRLWRAVFPYGLVTPHAANPYANPYVDVGYWYPKYYGGLHYREFHRFGYPTGDYPIRGTAW